MEKIPIVICIDVEPEERAIDPNVAADWIGFEKTFEFFEELRPRLEDTTRSAVHFSWFVRMDPQIAHTYGSPAWPVIRYRRLFDRIAASGDEVGLHIHPWRWDEGFDGWISDMGNQEWVGHCVRMGFDAFEQSLNQPCRSFRFGDHWMNDATLDLVEKLGGRFDLTPEPGRKMLALPEPHTGCPPDYTLVPHQPYRPSKVSFTQCSDSESRELWVVPLSTCDSDQMLSSLSAQGNGLHRGSFFTKLMMRGAIIRSGYEGFLDSADYEAVRGWAYDARQPDHSLEIELYDGKVPLAKLKADGLRGDLLKAGKGNGRHSFALPTPTCLMDGKPHSIRAKVANSAFELSNSPRAVKSDQSVLVEPGVMLLEPSGDPWLMSRMVAVLLSTLRERYLAISLRSHEILSHIHHVNMNENFANIFNHPLVKDFVFETPAELVARLE